MDWTQKLPQELRQGLEIPAVLNPSLEHFKNLASVRGPGLIQELEELEQQLRRALARSSEEAAVLERFHHLKLLQSFAKLELSFRQWQEFKHQVPGTSSTWYLKYT